MRSGRRRWRRLARVGCIPAVITTTGGLILFFNLITFWRAPVWVSDPREYLITARMLLSLGILVAIQILGTWGLGLLAASGGAAASRARGQWLRSRLRIARRWMFVYAWALLLLRLIFLLGVALATVFATTHLFGLRFDMDFLEDVLRALRMGPILVGGGLLAAVLHWLIGPFLRMRYSSALGALAATWTKRRDESIWAALTARLGAGLAGALTLLWGGALLVLILAMIFDPYSSSTRTYPELFPQQPFYIAQILTVMLAALFVFPAYAAGQLALPEFYIWLAQRRLARQQPTGEGNKKPPPSTEQRI